MTDTWYTCAPIESYWHDQKEIGDGVNLAGGVRIEKLPEWVKSDEALKHLSWSRRYEIQNAVDLVFSIQYEASSLGDPDLEWKGNNPRSIQEKAKELIYLANLALWLAKPSRIHFKSIITFDGFGSPGSLRESGTFQGLKYHVNDQDNLLNREDFARGARLHDAILKLDRTGTVWTSLRFLWKALTEDFWESRFVNLWIVLEAIFGPNNPQDISYRLSQRVAMFLGRDQKEVTELYKAVKKGYSWRSRTVHGLRLHKRSQEESSRVGHEVEGVVRRAIFLILEDSGTISKFDGSKREEFLDGLVFSRIR